ncbi:hypothetical protein [Streptomyces sp. NL15-2K]|uniref:hypothetical protein n=1 Tax=Streptomyces sp. NL15-2K TaxID=376149 RepID=UPI000F56B6E8|nr:MULTISPECIES: hypothetical protein [Actinomycetes]WKX15857.1 hypothetical protein Q4V64_53560 [Kutzneria buriramensis]GCB53348.1 hypothetical protein SNL152K_10705 [Streptomyces sp. NL15-2K]
MPADVLMLGRSLRAMSFAVHRGLSLDTLDQPSEEDIMTVICTAGIFSTVDGFGAAPKPGTWGGYWDKQGPELVDH